MSLAGQPTCSPCLGIDGVQLLVGCQHRSSFLRVLVDGRAGTGLGGRSSSCQTTIRRRRLISRLQAMEEELKMLRSGVAVLLHDTTPVPGANAQLRRFCADLGRLLVASRPAEGYDEGPGAPKSR